MPELKPLSAEAIPSALEKAERYRLLNEPAEAESICLDVLAADPENQQALTTLLLALTDRFSKGYGVGDTQPKRFWPESKANMSAPITAEYWPSVAPKRNSRAGRPAVIIKPTKASAKPCIGSRKPSRFALPATTTPFFVGTPARE